MVKCSINENESKWKNKIYKLAKVNDRIQILRLARPRNKRHQDINRGRWFDFKPC